MLVKCGTVGYGVILIIMELDGLIIGLIIDGQVVVGTTLIIGILTIDIGEEIKH